MDQQLSLSIIVPAYNVEAYIRASIVAITGQMHAGHELIVIDDGSSDATPAVLHQLQAAAPALAFHIVTQANQGVAAARNHGLALARGLYVAFVDSDDILLPGALAAIDAVIAAEQPDVIACDLRLWYPLREPKSRTVRAGYAPRVLTTDQDDILGVYFRDRHMYVWSKIFKRAIYTRHGDPVFPPGRVFEDVTAVPLLLASCAHLYYLPQCIIDYRQRPASISKSMTAKACVDLATALLPARARMAAAPLGQPTRMAFDLALSHIYLGIVKDSYRLPWAVGRDVRRQARSAFLEGLFHPLAVVFDALLPHPKLRRQLRTVLDGSLTFGLAQAISGRARAWRDSFRV